MAFPDEPQGTPVPSADLTPEIHHESELPPSSHEEAASPAVSAHDEAAVTGEVITDAAHAHYDEQQSYSDAWSSSYTEPGPPVNLTPEPPPRAALPPGGGGGGGKPPEPPDEEDEEEDGMTRMSFLEHLEELRSRILRALAGLGVAFLVCLCIGPQLWEIIEKPAHTALVNLKIDPPVLALIDPMDGFQIIWMKVPLLCAIFVASPWVLYQVWAFISPGLYKKEKKWAVPFVVSSSMLFIVGGLFAYFVAFRYGLEFLMGIGIDYGVRPYIDMNHYYDLFVDVMLGVGMIFEIPVLLFLLTLIHVASPAFLVRHSRYAILIIVILAAVITPTGDVFNLTLFATPMILLFYVGIFASYLLVLHREKRKFPWGIFLKWAGIGIAAISVLSYAAASYYGYHLLNHWPFLGR
jgi:sec-independent protein translocase protein TatC